MSGRIHGPLWVWTFLQGVLVLVLAVGVAWGTGAIQSRLEAGTARSVHHQAVLLALALERAPSDAAPELLTQAKRRTLSGWRLLDPDGEVVATSGAWDAPRLSPSGIRVALAGRENAWVESRAGTDLDPRTGLLRLRHLLESVGTPMRGASERVFVAVPTAGGGALVGFRTPQHSLEAVLGLAPELAWTVPIGIVLLALLALWSSWRLTRSLRRLEDVSRSVGHGVVSPDLTGLHDSRLDEVRALAASLEDMADRLRDRMAYNEQLSAHLVHELRTPLSTLRGALEFLEDADLPPDHRERFLGTAQTQVTRLGGLLDGLLELARAERSPARHRVDLVALAHEVADADADVSVHGGPATVAGDVDQLRAALHNLVRNACHHGAPPVRLEVGSDAEHAWVDVVDEGPGIPDADRQQVFDRFFTTRRGDHLGLGLPLVHTVAENHGGTLSLEDRERGCRFRLRLPRR